MSLSAKRKYLAKIHGRYQRASRAHKTRILDEFCLNCGYHRKVAVRLLGRPPGGRIRKRLKAALPEWLDYYERGRGPLAADIKARLLAISPAQIDRLL
jgi:hypothetical protein